jgi:hypothetical protein
LKTSNVRIINFIDKKIKLWYSDSYDAKQSEADMSKITDLAKDAFKRLKENKKVLGLTAAMVAFSPSANAEDQVKQDDLPKNNKELSLNDLKFQVDPSTLDGAFEIKENDEVATETLQAKPIQKAPEGPARYATPSGYRMEVTGTSNTEEAKCFDFGDEKIFIEKGQYTCNDSQNQTGVVAIHILEKTGLGYYNLSTTSIADAIASGSNLNEYVTKIERYYSDYSVGDTDPEMSNFGLKRIKQTEIELKKLLTKRNNDPYLCSYEQKGGIIVYNKAGEPKVISVKGGFKYHINNNTVSKNLGKALTEINSSERGK